MILQIFLQICNLERVNISIYYQRFYLQCYLSTLAVFLLVLGDDHFVFTCFPSLLCFELLLGYLFQLHLFFDLIFFFTSFRYTRFLLYWLFIALNHLHSLLALYFNFLNNSLLFLGRKIVRIRSNSLHQ